MEVIVKEFHNETFYDKPTIYASDLLQEYIEDYIDKPEQIISLTTPTAVYQGMDGVESSTYIILVHTKVELKRGY